MAEDPLQKNNLLGHITYGQDYGTFLQHVQRQDKNIWPIVNDLDQRLNELLREKNGSRIPDWNRN